MNGQKEIKVCLHGWLEDWKTFKWKGRWEVLLSLWHIKTMSGVLNVVNLYAIWNILGITFWFNRTFFFLHYTNHSSMCASTCSKVRSGGSSLSRWAQTPFPPASSSSSSGRTLWCSQASWDIASLRCHGSSLGSPCLLDMLRTPLYGGIQGASLTYTQTSSTCSSL